MRGVVRACGAEASALAPAVRIGPQLQFRPDLAIDSAILCRGRQI
jgi:hypothetical protein